MTLRFATIALSALLLSTAASAQSGVVKDAYIGCISEDDLSNLMSAIASDDTMLRDTMMGKVCVPIQGQKFSVLEPGIMTAKIRVYVSDNFVDLYVPAEATR